MYAAALELIQINAGAIQVRNIYVGRMNMARLPYLQTMFGTCMLFQTIYALCVLLWLALPELKGHTLLLALFPNFNLLTLGSFIYGLIASMVYGWITAVIFFLL